MRLQSNDSLPIKGAKYSATVSLGYLLSVLAKYAVNFYTPNKYTIEQWEWAIPIVGFIISLLMFLISLAFPSEKKKVLKKIQKHFSEAPQVTEIRNGR